MNERLIESEMEKQETPTLEEVRLKYKDVASILVLGNEVCELDILKYGLDYSSGEIREGDNNKGWNLLLWSKERGYAEIVSYKKPQIEELIDIIKQDSPVEIVAKKALRGAELAQQIKKCADVFGGKNKPKPKQYDIGIDTFQRAEANMTLEEIMSCVKFSIDKYNWRKKGQDREDLVKIIDYCNFAIKQIDNDANRRSNTL